LTEPFIEFFRYLPAPAFGALAVAILGICIAFLVRNKALSEEAA